LEPHKHRPVWEEDAVVPELVDTLEFREEQLKKAHDELDRIRAEKEKLETDLVIAEGTVAALARELEAADAQLKELRPLYSRIGKIAR
jgi:chromosome segregation ATPase